MNQKEALEQVMQLAASKHDIMPDQASAQILTAFQLKFFPDMLMGIALIKAMLDGAEAAAPSHFSVAEYSFLFFSLQT